jgi:hypothetical protein
MIPSSPECRAPLKFGNYVLDSQKLSGAVHIAILTVLLMQCLLPLSYAAEAGEQGQASEAGVGPLSGKFGTRLLEATPGYSLWRKLGLSFSGYLEGSYTQNFNTPSNRINEVRIFDVNSNQFRPNVAQFVVEREAKGTGDWTQRWGFRGKFNVGKDSAFIGGANLSALADFQEFYIQYIAPTGNGLNLQLGNINSVIGYEVVESPLNANYSRSWLFGLGQPFTTRGLRASYEFNTQVSWSLGVINRINSSLSTERQDPWVESALTLAPTDKVKLTLYGLVGDGVGNKGVNWGDLLLGGGFLRWLVSPHASLAVESYYANLVDGSLVSPGKNAKWGGIAGYVIYDFTHQWGIRLRSEIFEDSGGLVSCAGTTAYQPKANVCFGATSTATAPPIGQTLGETTSTLQYKPVPALTTRLEFRYDKSDQHVFQIGGRAANYQPTLSLEGIYHF